MSTIHQTLEAARAYTGRPTTDKINKDDLFMMMLGRLYYYRQKLGLTSQNWLIAEAFINVDEQNNEYRLNVADFSRPIKVEFYDPTFPNRNGPEVEIIELQNTDRFNRNPDSNFYYGESGDTGSAGSRIASYIAFYGMPPLDLKYRVVPRPVQAAQYRIFYEPIAAADSAPTFAENPALMTQFHDMLALATALVALPRCDYNTDKYTQYDNTLTRELARVENVFDIFRLSRKHNDTRLRRPFSPGGGGSHWTR